ncbi:MAG TPA: maleylpyruvate isomerase family mycothiol-dependent enzyme, partial [Acidimicrobiales bacterium]|nr:maleylpyruvate isomerase family mycothiol-dependent enzyme [Acidimicrobiales bacterium]
MTLPRDVVVPSVQAEYRSFEALLRTLSVDEWERPTRCAGWRTADVAAHVVGQLTDVVNLRLDGLGTPEVTERQVAEHRGRTAAELADELDGSTKVAGDLLAAFDDT